MSDYSIVRASEAPDYTGDAPGAFLGYGRPGGAEQIAFNVRVLAPHTRHSPPGTDPSAGHSHRTIEELYFVIDGEIEIKLGEDLTTLRPRDAVRISPSTPRAFRNNSDRDAIVAMCSVRVEDPHAEAQWHEGFWPS